MKFNRFTTDTIVGTKTFTNVIATLNKDSPRKVVLACHIDSMDKPGLGFESKLESL